MIVLFEQYQKRKADEMKFQAQVAGAELKKKEEDKFLFKDPKDYEDMPMEERRKLTEEMKAHFMSKLGGGKLSG